MSEFNNNYPTQNNAPQRNEYGEEIISLNKYIAKTFFWMFLGLLFTFAIAGFLYSTGGIYYLFAIPALPFILLIAEIVVVIVLSRKIQQMSIPKARTLFFVYAALNGVMFTAYFVMYDVSTMFLAFGVTAVLFGVMALMGYCTKANLSKIRTVLIVGVVFLLVFWVLSIFIDLDAFTRLACFIGIAIFTAFTAYDIQKLKFFHAQYAADSELAEKSSIYGALQLYLDFINIFIYVLRIIGRRK